jgi:hypothetical protein
MATPPNVDNLSLFKGIIKSKPVTQSGALVDRGECLSFTTSMSAETLVYNSRRHSSRIPVKTVTLGKTMTVGITMSEFDLTNLEMWSMGEASGSPSTIEIGTAAEVRHWIRYIGTNEVGQAYQVDLYDVLLTPNGDLEWLSDTDWSEMQLTGSVNADPTTGSFGQIRAITAGVPVAAGSPPV